MNWELYEVWAEDENRLLKWLRLNQIWVIMPVSSIWKTKKALWKKSNDLNTVDNLDKWCYTISIV